MTSWDILWFTFGYTAGVAGTFTFFALSCCSFYSGVVAAAAATAAAATTTTTTTSATAILIAIFFTTRTTMKIITHFEAHHSMIPCIVIQVLPLHNIVNAHDTNMNDSFNLISSVGQADHQHVIQPHWIRIYCFHGNSFINGILHF